jgi:hypothetical protein
LQQLLFVFVQFVRSPIHWMPRNARPEKPAPQTARLPANGKAANWRLCECKATNQVSSEQRQSAMTDRLETEIETLTPAAIRMRLYRDRRRKELRCVTIEVRETEIDILVQRGLLLGEMRHDPIAVRDALHSFLDQTLNY